MANLLRRVVNRIRRIGQATPTLAPKVRPDIAPEDRAILAKVQMFTMTSEERILAMIDAVRYVQKYGIAGAVVECGVWRGGSAMVAALVFQEMKDTSREIYLYDTFEGMPPPTKVDRSYDGKTAEVQIRAVQGKWCYASLEDVRTNMASTGYPMEKIRFVQGKVEETIPGTIPDQISLLRLDTDWYESTRHELEHLFPRLSMGGVMIADDYGHWQGHRQAIDEYIARMNRPILLNRIDYAGRIAIKTS